MKKRVLIDATTIVEKKDGLSQYIISLLDNINPVDFEVFDFSVLVNKGVQRKEFWAALQNRPFNVIEATIAPIGPKRDWDLFWYFRKNKNTFDLFHSTSNQYPLFLKNGIATVHDITFRKYLDTAWWSFNMAKRFLNLVIKNAMYNSAAVIAVSNATKNDLVNSYALNKSIENKITVIYEGWEHIINNEARIEEQEKGMDFNNYLFYVGTTRLHKNIKNLIKAFQIVSNELPNIQLVISGNETYLDNEDKENIAVINAAARRIVFTGFVSNTTLEHLFKKADAFIFPSFSEGFGIPVLESFYFNKPLLCSNTTSLPEIAGDAALYFDPADPSDIAACISKFYSNPGLREILVTKGRERLQLFSWKKMAEETVALYCKYFASRLNDA